MNIPTYIDKELLLKDICSSLTLRSRDWQSKTRPFVFCKNNDGWYWSCKDVVLRKKLNQDGLQRYDFETRKDAVCYLDAILGTSMASQGFFLATTGYICKKYNWELLIWPDKKWVIYHLYDKQYTLENGVVKRSNTRREAIEYMIHHYPQFLV